MNRTPSGGERQLAASDLRVGEIATRREVRLDAEAFRQFARLTGDAHPIHYDEAYAQQQGLAAPLAHGLLLTAMTALGATDLSARLHDSMVAMIGAQSEFLAPVTAGMTLEARFTTTRVEARSRNRSLVEFEVELRRGDQVHARVRQQYLLKTHLSKAT